MTVCILLSMGVNEFKTILEVGNPHQYTDYWFYGHSKQNRTLQFGANDSVITDPAKSPADKCYYTVVFQAQEEKLHVINSPTMSRNPRDGFKP